MNIADDKQAFAKRVARSFVYSGIGNVLGRVTALVGIVIGITMLTSAEFGAVGLAVPVLAIVRAFTEAGLGVALVQAQSATRKQIDSLFWTSLIITVGAYAVVFFGVAPIVALVYPKFPGIDDLIRGMCFSVALYTFYFIPRAFMERELLFGRLMIIDNLSFVIATVLLYVSAARGAGAWAFVWFEIGQRGSQAVLSMLARPFLPGLRMNFAEIRGMFNFAMFATGSRILFNLYNNADFFVVGRFFGDSVLGVYHAAWRVVAEPVRGLAMAVNQVAYPAFARLQGDLPRLRQYFFRINHVSLAFIGSVLGLVVVYSGPTIRALEQIPREYEEAIPLIWLFGIIGVLRAIAPLVPQLLNAAGQSRLNFFYSLTCAVVLPAAFVIGAYSGIRGVVLAWVIGYPLVVMVLFYFGAVVLQIRPWVMLRSFAGLRLAGPAFVIELGVYYGLRELVGLGDGLTAAIGAPLSLALAVGLIYWTERDNIAALRKRSANPSDHSPD